MFVSADMLKLTTRRGRAYMLRYLVNYPRAVLRIVNLIRRERVDLVHTNTLHNLYGFAAAALTRRPHLWHVREIVMQSPLFRSVETFLAKHFSDRLIVTSEAVAEMFAMRRGLPAHLRRIPNSIDLREFHPRNDGGGVRAELGIPAEAPLLGLVCRLDHWKGVDTFIRAAALCAEECPGAHFVVVGGPVEGREEYAGEMRQLASDLGLEGRLHFTGWRYSAGDMPQVHAALDVLVLASSWPEPFGLVLLEGMATGKPVVATNHGGPREICADGETGLLVPPRDPRAMADALLTLLRDPARASAMGQAGRRRAENLFDRERCIRQLEQLYEEVLAT